MCLMRHICIRDMFVICKRHACVLSFCLCIEFFCLCIGFFVCALGLVFVLGSFMCI